MERILSPAIVSFLFVVYFTLTPFTQTLLNVSLSATTFRLNEFRPMNFTSVQKPIRLASNFQYFHLFPLVLFLPVQDEERKTIPFNVKFSTSGRFAVKMLVVIKELR